MLMDVWVFLTAFLFCVRTTSVLLETPILTATPNIANDTYKPGQSYEWYQKMYKDNKGEIIALGAKSLEGRSAIMTLVKIRTNSTHCYFNTTREYPVFGDCKDDACTLARWWYWFNTAPYDPATNSIVHLMDHQYPGKYGITFMDVSTGEISKERPLIVSLERWGGIGAPQLYNGQIVGITYEGDTPYVCRVDLTVQGNLTLQLEPKPLPIWKLYSIPVSTIDTQRGVYYVSDTDSIFKINLNPYSTSKIELGDIGKDTIISWIGWDSKRSKLMALINCYGPSGTCGPTQLYDISDDGKLEPLAKLPDVGAAGLWSDSFFDEDNREFWAWTYRTDDGSHGCPYVAPDGSQHGCVWVSKTTY